MTGAEKMIKLLAMLADQCGEKLSPERLDFVVGRLVQVGQPEAIIATLIDLLDSARRFPTVAEIKAKAGLAAPSEDDVAREIGERIFAAISKYGTIVGTPGVDEHGTPNIALQQRDRIDKFVGPIGVEVIRLQGGWNQICEMVTNDNASTLKAQWRELAAVIARRGGKLGDAPGLDNALPPPNVQAMIDVASRQVVEVK